MKINLRKVTSLELIGEVENNENKEYHLLIRVSPDGLTHPANREDDPIQKVGVSDGLARVVPQSFVDAYYETPRE